MPGVTARGVVAIHGYPDRGGVSGFAETTGRPFGGPGELPLPLPPPNAGPPPS